MNFCCVLINAFNLTLLFGCKSSTVATILPYKQLRSQLASHGELKQVPMDVGEIRHNI
jgi:hypothetical protein